MSKRLIVIESPYAGDVTANVAYARRCLRHSVAIGESPYAGHLLMTQVLDDLVPEERELGIACHLAWIDATKAIAVYTDRGISRGMQAAIDYATTIGAAIEYRKLGDTP